MLPKMQVVFTLATPDAKPALTDDISNDESSEAQYYLHLEATANILLPDNPGKVDVLFWGTDAYDDKGKGLLEVYVQFGGSGYELAQTSIKRCESQLNDPGIASYKTDKDYIGDMNADEVMDRFDAEQGVALAIGQEDNWVSFLEIDRWRPQDFASMTVIYRQLDEDRVLTISARVEYEDAIVDELIARVEAVAAQYRDLPMKRYTGAVYR